MSSLLPLPQHVYLDTNVIVYALVRGMAHSDICLDACQRLIDNGSSVYIANLTRLEFLQAVRGLANSQSLPEDTRQKFGLDQWEDTVVREQWFNFWTNQFDQFLDAFDVYHELPYRPESWWHVSKTMADGPMAAYDAFHLSTAILYGISDLWTTDNGFSRASGIQVALLHRISR